MEETFSSSEAALITRNRALAWLAASPLFLTIPSLVAGALISPQFFGATILSLILGSLLSVLVYVVNPLAKRDASGITADARGLSTRAGATIPREELTQGLVFPGRDGVHVQLSRKGARLPAQVAVHDAAEGVRLLKALGLDASHSVASFFGMSRVYASAKGFFANTALLFLGPVLLGVLAGALHAPPLAFAAMLVGAFAYVSFFMPMRLKVGGDGLIVSWYGRKRFLSYADVELVTRYEVLFGTSRIRGVSIRLRSGEELRVPLGYGYWDSGRTGVAEERIREAIEAYGRGDQRAESATLERGDRSGSEWILALRRIGSGANEGPRTAAIPRDALFRIVESASTKASVRAAAAVALGPGLDEGDRARLRGIAEGTNETKLRVALNVASTEEDDAALAEALSDLEGQEQSDMRS